MWEKAGASVVETPDLQQLLELARILPGGSQLLSKPAI